MSACRKRYWSFRDGWLISEAYTWFRPYVVVNLIREKQEKRAPVRIMKKSELLVTAFLTISLMIILDRAFDFLGIMQFPWIGNYINLTTVALGIACSLLGIFLSFRTILRTEYRENLQKGIILALLTSGLFLLYGAVFVTISYSHLFGFEFWLRTWGIGVFLSSLTGCLVGFLLGGIKLQRMPPPKITERPRVGAWMVLTLVIGAVMGYFAGHIVWIIFGQIQIAIGIAFPYAAIFPSPLIYQIAWTILGALSFPFKVLPALLE